METFKDVLLTYLTKLVMPNSPAYGNSIPFAKQDSLTDAISNIQVGDVILTKTHHSIYQAARRFLKTEFDHISIVINEKQVIHISPPIISKLDIRCLLQKSRQPLIYRYPIQNKQNLLGILNNFLGERYNEKALFQMMKRQIQKRFNAGQHHSFNITNIKYSRICSDAILYALCRSNEKLHNSITAFAEKKSRYSELGYFLVSQIGDFLEQNGASIVFRCPPNTDKTLLDHSMWIQKYMQNMTRQILPYVKFFNKISQKKNKVPIPKSLKSIFFNFVTKKNPQVQMLLIIYFLYKFARSNNAKVMMTKAIIENILYWFMLTKMLPQFPTLVAKL